MKYYQGPDNNDRRWVASNIAIALAKKPLLKTLKNCFRPLYHGLQWVYLGDVLSNNILLKDRYAGQQCFILGTGVSLNDIDLTLLADRYTFSCNEIFNDKAFEALNLSFYTVAEPYFGRLFGPKYLEDVYGLYSDIDRAFASMNTEFFFDGTLKHYFQRHRLLSNKSIFYFLSKRPLASSKSHENDLTKRITFTDGAIFTMIACALYMGFKEIFMLGCGYTFHPVQLYHFYDYPVLPCSTPEAERKRQLEQFERDNPHQRILGLKEEGEEIILNVSFREIPQDHYDKHHRVRKFADSKSATIYNVIPEGFESPAYQGITIDKFNKDILDLGHRVA